ncbi:MAG: hypothetical protein V1698_02495 [bacterium]
MEDIVLPRRTGNQVSEFIRICVYSGSWISNLTRKALEPYYGGDHSAHTRRISDAHINGGHDQMEFFSFEQKIFI